MIMRIVFGLLRISIIIFASCLLWYTIKHCNLRPHNNGNCIENHCLGDEVIIKQLGVKGYISDYYRWKPSVPIDYTITYKTDVGEAKTIVVKDFELIFK